MQELQKNSQEVVRIERAEYKGTDCVNARIWFQGSDGVMRPSRKGMTLNVQLARDVANAILEACDHA